MTESAGYENVRDSLAPASPGSFDYAQSALTWFTDEVFQNYNISPVNEQVRRDHKIFHPARPPYSLIRDQRLAREALFDAFKDNSFLLLHGYAGAGKTTVTRQMAAKVPDSIFYFDQCSQRSPSSLLGMIAEKLGLSIKQRISEIEPIVNALRLSGRHMLIFDDIVLDNDQENYKRINLITSIYETTGQPVVICGTNALYHRLYDDRKLDKYDHIRSRLIRQEMKGITSAEAIEYLEMMKEQEKICFSPNAGQALSSIATNPKQAGIRKFTTIIGRITSAARAEFYSTGGRCIPPNSLCIEQVTAPGSGDVSRAFIYVLPKTTEMLFIPDEMVLEEIEKCVGEITNPKTRGRKKMKPLVQEDETEESDE